MDWNKCNHYGPPQEWQIVMWETVTTIPPLLRLKRMRNRGLPVGPGTRYLGGISERIAYHYARIGLVLLVRNNENKIVRIIPRQYSFSF